jgi:hypothetical protein
MALQKHFQPRAQGGVIATNPIKEGRALYSRRFRQGGLEEKFLQILVGFGHSRSMRLQVFSSVRRSATKTITLSKA